MSITIHREQFGQGKSLVMLHGWAMHSGVWRDFAEQLSCHYRVICLDLPGHGRSGGGESFELVSVAEQLLQAIDEPEFYLMGWSLGAVLGLKMAELQPSRVTKLLLLAGNPHFVESADWPGTATATLDGFAAMLAEAVQPTLARFLALQVNGLSHSKALLRRLAASVEQCPPPSASVLQAGLQVLKTADLRASLSALPQPLAVVLGERDRLVPVAVGNHLLRLKPDLALTVVPGAGHAPFLSHPELLLDDMRRFFQ